MSAVLSSTLAERPASVPVAATRPAVRPWGVGLLASLAWGGTAALTLLVPNTVSGFTDWPYTDEAGWFAAGVAVVLAVIALTGPFAGRAGDAVLRRVRPAGPWIIAIAAGLGLWELLTAKLGRLPTPFFAPPTALAEVYLDDWKRLGESTWNSAKLLVYGVAWGAVVGFLVGVSIGWSRAIGYWVHPVIRFLGPVPASALLPLAFFAFPSSYAAAVFLIALATGFPVAVLTWSGVASVNKQYYDVARTLGASQAFLVLRVAIPAALPQVFVGLFMGLGAAFSILVTAEMMGVKSGLGWYLT